MEEGSMLDELAKLGVALDGASFRRAFALDPQLAMQASGIDASQISPDVIDSLAELSPAELRVLTHVKDALENAGIDLGIRAYMV
jgi:hypothetical protein